MATDVRQGCRRPAAWRRGILCWFLLSLTAFAGCVGSPGSEEPEARTPVLTCLDPCGTPIDSGGRWEPAVAVDPTDPSHIVASSQDLSRNPGGLVSIHWPLSHVSFDGGETWETRPLPGGAKESPTHPLYRYDAMDDSVVTILPDGTVLWSAVAWTRAPPDAIPGRVPNSLVVLRSHDGGLTYPEAVVVQEGSGWRTAAGGVHEDYQDKQWPAVTPDGQVLLVWSRNFEGGAECGAPTDACTDLVYSLSPDGGVSWPAPRVVATDGLYSGAFPVILSDGSWVVSYRDTRAKEVRVAVSTDEGAEWTTQAIDKSTKFPVLAAVEEAHGERIYMAYPAGEGDRDDLQVVALRWSDDGGDTWSAPVVVDAPEHPGRTIPAIAPAGDDGVVVLSWHPLREGAELYASLYRDGNLTGPLVVARTTGSSTPTGDYMGLASLPDGDVYAVWNAYDGEGFTITGARLGVR